MTECQPTVFRPLLPPHKYKAYASNPPLDIVEQVQKLFKSKNQGQHLVSKNL